MPRLVAAVDGVSRCPSRESQGRTSAPELFLMTTVIVDTFFELGVPLLEFVLDDVQLRATLSESDFMKGPQGSTSESAAHTTESRRSRVFVVPLFKRTAPILSRPLRWRLAALETAPSVVGTSLYAAQTTSALFAHPDTLENGWFNFNGASFAI